jgi:hypothetical protein
MYVAFTHGVTCSSLNSTVEALCRGSKSASIFRPHFWDPEMMSLEIEQSNVFGTK